MNVQLFAKQQKDTIMHIFHGFYRHFRSLVVLPNEGVQFHRT